MLNLSPALFDHPVSPLETICQSPSVLVAIPERRHDMPTTAIGMCDVLSSWYICEGMTKNQTQKEKGVREDENDAEVGYMREATWPFLLLALKKQIFSLE